MPAREFKKVLIVRLSAMGDVIHVLPSLDALRRALPSAYIAWLVEDRAASLLHGHPQVDRVHVLPRGKITKALLAERRPVAAMTALSAVYRDLRRERFDVAIDFQSNLRSALSSVASGARLRVGFGRGFCKEGSYVFFHRRVRPPSKRMHKVEKNFTLLHALGIDTAGARARLEIPDAARARVAPFFDGLGAGRVVALHPGVSKFGAFKQWAPDRYAAVAEALAARHGVRSVVTWGPGERPLAEEVASRAPAAATVAPETSSILELAAIYARCDAVVGCDTGPVHLAAALGVPVIGLYGPKDPYIYAPWSSRTGARADTIWKQVHCSPCTLRWCGNVICMPAITAEDVIDAVRKAVPDAAAPRA